jgi:hypothetical protein
MRVTKSKLIWLSVGVLIALPVTWAILFVWTPATPRHDAPAVRTPFTATKLYQHFDEDGVELSRSYAIEAFRADGSSGARIKSYRNQTGHGPAAYEERRHFTDFQEKKKFHILPEAGCYWTDEVSDRTIQQVTAHPDWNLQVMRRIGLIATDAEPRTILGYEVVRSPATSRLSYSPQGLRRETWLAPELEGYPLRMTFYRQDPVTGRRFIKSTHTVVSISEGEPDPELFTVPDGFYESPTFDEQRRPCPPS